MVGAPAADGVYLFARTVTGWHLVVQLKGSDTAPHDDFGGSVAISSNTIAIGASGHAALRGERTYSRDRNRHRHPVGHRHDGQRHLHHRRRAPRRCSGTPAAWRSDSAGDLYIAGQQPGQTWELWARPIETASCLTEAGRRMARWAADMAEQFLGDEWLGKALGGPVTSWMPDGEPGSEPYTPDPWGGSIVLVQGEHVGSEVCGKLLEHALQRTCPYHDARLCVTDRGQHCRRRAERGPHEVESQLMGAVTGAHVMSGFVDWRIVSKSSEPFTRILMGVGQLGLGSARPGGSPGPARLTGSRAWSDGAGRPAQTNAPASRRGLNRSRSHRSVVLVIRPRMPGPAWRTMGRQARETRTRGGDDATPYQGHPQGGEGFSRSLPDSVLVPEPKSLIRPVRRPSPERLRCPTLDQQ